MAGELGRREQVPPTPETTSETTGEVFVSSPSQERTPLPSEQAPLTAPPVRIPTTTAPAQMDPVLRTVEDILSEDLGDAYKQLAPDTQQQFKKKGEAVARTVQQMIATGAFHAKKVLALVLDWLRLIPHVNRFFLEQEAKRKIDKLTHLAERERRTRV